MQTKKEILKLKVNPIVRTSHYEHYFHVSNATASRYHKIDRDALGKNRLTFEDFEMLYDCYPDWNFKPQFRAKN